MEHWIELLCFVLFCGEILCEFFDYIVLGLSMLLTFVKPNSRDRFDRIDEDVDSMWIILPKKYLMIIWIS